jgi:hypothetical protein
MCKCTFSLHYTIKGHAAADTPWHEKLKIGEPSVHCRRCGSFGVLKTEHDQVDNVRILALCDRDGRCLKKWQKKITAKLN